MLQAAGAGTMGTIGTRLMYDASCSTHSQRSPFDSRTKAFRIEGNCVLRLASPSKPRLNSTSRAPVRGHTKPRHLVFLPSCSVLFCSLQANKRPCAVEFATGECASMPYQLSLTFSSPETYGRDTIDIRLTPGRAAISFSLFVSYSSFLVTLIITRDRENGILKHSLKTTLCVEAR